VIGHVLATPGNDFAETVAREAAPIRAELKSYQTFPVQAILAQNATSQLIQKQRESAVRASFVSWPEPARIGSYISDKTKRAHSTPNMPQVVLTIGFAQNLDAADLLWRSN
jgi:hypothetical protein